MKKLIVLSLFIYLSAIPVFSAQIFKSNNYYGLKNSKGEVILNTQYNAIEQLSYSPSKKVIIPMHAMDDTQPKKLELYKIKQNNLWGVANSSGKVIKECKYKNIEADNNGDLIYTHSDGTTEYAHPVLNATKAARDTIVTIVGLPVTIIGTVMIPIEAVSKASRKK